VDIDPHRFCSAIDFDIGESPGAGLVGETIPCYQERRVWAEVNSTKDAGEMSGAKNALEGSGRGARPAQSICPDVEYGKP